MNILTLLEMAADSFQDRAAITDDGASYTAAELLERARVLAPVLTGGSNRDAVLYIGPHGVRFATALFACAAAGKPFVPLNYRLSEEQLTRLAARHPDALIVADPSVAPSAPNERLDLEAVLSQTGTGSSEAACQDGERLAVILYTSGASRRAEGCRASPPAPHVLHPERRRVRLCRSRGCRARRGAAVSHRRCGEPADEPLRRTAKCLPAQVYPRGLARHLGAGTRYPGDACEPMLARLADHLEATGDSPPPSLRLLAYGGAKTSPPVLERALRAFPDVPFVHACAWPETTSSIAVLGPGDHDAARRGDPEAVARLASVGRVVPTVEVRIVGADGNPVAPGEVGEIVVRGPQVSGEYLGMEGTPSEWFATRDLGRIDAGGYLLVLGRADDTIIRGGDPRTGRDRGDSRRASRSRRGRRRRSAEQTWGEEVGAVIVLADGGSVEAVRESARPAAADVEGAVAVRRRRRSSVLGDRQARPSSAPRPLPDYGRVLTFDAGEAARPALAAGYQSTGWWTG